jgi:hypothetical protein
MMNIEFSSKFLLMLSQKKKKGSIEHYIQCAFIYFLLDKSLSTVIYLKDFLESFVVIFVMFLLYIIIARVN